MKPQIAGICTLAALFLLAGCGGSGNPTSPPAEVQVPDTAPPAVPTGLQAASGDDVVKLGWNPNTTDADFYAYNVYRMIAGRGVLLTEEPVSEPHFIDQKPWPEGNQYAVTSVDAAGNESAWTTVVFQAAWDHPKPGLGR